MFDFKRYTRAAIFILSANILSTPTAHSADLGNGWAPSAVEISKLPDYCRKWFYEKVVPPNCDGVHHLCAGKVLINRTRDYTIPKAERQRILRMAKGEIGYIFTRKNEFCAKMPDAKAAESDIRVMEAILR